MSISPMQITEARRLLRRGSTWLARASHIDYRTVVSAQQSRGVEAADPFVVSALRRTLEAAGIEFTTEDEGGATVRLRTPSAAA